MSNVKTKSIDTAIKGTVQARGSLSEVGSRSYFAENLHKVLHHELKCYSDAQQWSKDNNNKQVQGVYMRFEMDQKKKKKIGKGIVDSTGITRDPHTSGSEQPLETDVFIPCVSESAALTLEDALHRHFGKTERVHNAIESKVDIANKRWLKPGVNSESKEGGTELFTFEDIWEDSVDVFVDAIKLLVKQSQVNQEDFTKKARDPQVSGSDLLCEWLLNGGDMQDFFLLMKPRAGKNATMCWGIAKYVEILKKTNPDKTITIDFMSLWPSAFSGALDDLEKMFYVNGITLKGVNTSDDDWKETYEALLLDPTVDAVFRFASLQSIDVDLAKEYNKDEDREGIEIDYVPAKSEYFKSNPGNICIIDESDHGMRTTRSTDVLTEFGYTKRVWMSGTDLYALKNKIVFNPIQNHFLYDILDEIQDVKAGKHKMPLMEKHSLVAETLPGEEIDSALMSQKEITRKLVVLFDVAEKYGKLDNFKDRFLDEDGNVLKFKYIREVKRLWEMIYFWNDVKFPTSTPSPENLKHLFCCMPSVKSCMAMYNHIQSGDIECEHKVLLANLFGSADRIEQQVNDAMIGKDTIFLTVGKMLRGAKAPWNGVIRFDRYSDYKVGLQLELRGQNTDEDKFHVYDANCFRAESMKYDLIKSRETGKKIDSEGKKLHNLIPMTRKGEFGEETVSWDDCVSSWQAGRITEGYKRDTLFNEDGLQAAQEMLKGSNKTQDNVKSSKDDREGTEGSSNKKSGGPTGPIDKDELKVLKQQAKTLSTMLPILLIISDCKYREIDTLINNTSDEDLRDLLKSKCNIKKIDSDFKQKIIAMFDAEEINHQLYITYKKLENGEEIDWSEFGNASNQDITVTESLAIDMINTVKSHINRAKTLADVSCGTGELMVQAVKQGFSGKIYLFDGCGVNIKITKLRLAKLEFDNIETFVYNKPKDFINIELENDMKIDVMLGNPPYEGKAQTHQKFFNKCVELVADDGVVSFIQPDTAYSSKKDYVGYKVYGHTNKMQDNIKKYKTSVKFVEGTVFDGADVATSLAITTLTKTLDSTIEVEYLSGDNYPHIDLENINKAGVEPVLYNLLKKKIESYVATRGSMHDIEYCDINSKVTKDVYKISMVRGNRGTDDFYTMVTRNKDYHKVEASCFGFEIEQSQEKSMYSYLTSFVARFALSIYKTNTNNHVGEMRIVPLVPFDRIWTDEMLAKEMGITPKELDSIKQILPNYYNL
jgi:precorrin-6B methylase 2